MGSERRRLARSLGLLGNRGLAYEGLYQWKEAVGDYTAAIEIGKTIDSQLPYFLNRQASSAAEDRPANRTAQFPPTPTPRRSRRRGGGRRGVQPVRAGG